MAMPLSQGDAKSRLSVSCKHRNINIT